MHPITNPMNALLFSATGVDFAITQIVDGNWGVHATVPKWMFGADTPYDYTCSFNNPSGTSGARRALATDARARKLVEGLGMADEHTAVRKLADNVRRMHAGAAEGVVNAIGRRMFEAKLKLAEKYANPLLAGRILKALQASAKGN